MELTAEIRPVFADDRALTEVWATAFQIAAT
jgi:hypothetical protein